MRAVSGEELANAATMLLPAAVFALNATRSHANALLLLGACMHLPVSLTYHLSAACGRYPDAIDNDMRRLDQSLQHVVAVLYSYALSGARHAALNLCANAPCIAALWNPKTSNDGRRWMPIAAAVLLYAVPAVPLRALLVPAVAGAVCFACRCPWSHAVFHLALVPFAQALADAACENHAIYM